MPEFKPFSLADSLNTGMNVAINSYRLRDAQDTLAAKQGYRQALQAGTPEAMQTYSQQYPEYAMAMKGAQDKLKTNEYDVLTKGMDYISRGAGLVKDQSSYDSFRQTLVQNNLAKPDDLPTQYNAETAKMLQTMGMTAKERLNYSLNLRRTAAYENLAGARAAGGGASGQTLALINWLQKNTGASPDQAFRMAQDFKQNPGKARVDLYKSLKKTYMDNADPTRPPPSDQDIWREVDTIVGQAYDSMGRQPAAAGPVQVPGFMGQPRGVPPTGSVLDISRSMPAPDTTPSQPIGMGEPPRTTVRGTPPARAPYQEGTQLVGPGGQRYIVRGGVPVLMDAAIPAPPEDIE